MLSNPRVVVAVVIELWAIMGRSSVEYTLALGQVLNLID
jgi:hypothetical protein